MQLILLGLENIYISVSSWQYNYSHKTLKRYVSCHINLKVSYWSQLGRSESTSSVAFEMLIINCQMELINLFIFNWLTPNINVFTFNCLKSNFWFRKNISFARRKELLVMDARASLVLDRKLPRENDDIIFLIQRSILRYHTLCTSILKCGLPTKGIKLTRFVHFGVLGVSQLWAISV